MQKRLVLVCEDSLCPRKQPDVSGPGLGEAGRYNTPVPEPEKLNEEGQRLDQVFSQDEGTRLVHDPLPQKLLVHDALPI